jgi:YkoY family integral membrane protein
MPPELLSNLSVIAALVLIEGLLSVDNALGIAVYANRLPEHQRQQALRLGFIGAYAFRVIALFCVALIKDNPVLTMVGALYLVWLMCSEVTRAKPKHEARAEGEGEGEAEFWPSVGKIGVLDLSLSLDNVVTAIAFTDNIWLIYVGVLIAILVLRFFAGWCLRLLERFPFLEKTAFVLVGYVGLVLLAKQWFGVHIQAPVKFAGVVVLVGLAFAHAYVGWVRRLLAGVFFLLRPPMLAIAWVGGLLGTLIVVPVGWLVRAVRRQPREQ